MLTVARPTLTYPATTGGQAPLEQPLDVHVGPVMLDGQVLGADMLTTSGYFVYRQAGSAARLEVWDDTSRSWRLDVDAFATPPGPTPAKLAPEPDQPEPWHGIIVAAGGTDAAGQPQFAPAAGGYPYYSVRAAFAAKDSGELASAGRARRSRSCPAATPT